ncbi:MAG: PIN domain-containing protein [Bacillota bacterium]
MKSKPSVTVPVVIDTNVLVPSLYSETNIYKFISEGNLVLIWNDYIRSEALEIIERLSIKNRKYSKSKEKALKLVELIFYPLNKVDEMPENWEGSSPDPDDNPFLFAAEQGGAEYIISSDKRDMLSLGHFKNIPIGRPKDSFDWALIYRPLE